MQPSTAIVSPTDAQLKAAERWTLVKDSSNNPIAIDGFSAAASTNTNVEIVEVNATDDKAVAYGTAIINKA